MEFIQIVEFDTSQIEEMRALGRKYQDDTGDRPGRRGAILCADRDNPNHYFVIAEFDSHDDAMRNSEMPETQALAGEMGKLSDGPAAFRNLDVLERWS